VVNAPPTDGDPERAQLFAHEAEYTPATIPPHRSPDAPTPYRSHSKDANVLRTERRVPALPH
jgi:hypothetical protein